MSSQLGSGDVRAFVLAGRAIFTVVSVATGARFTFRVRRTRDESSPLRFVDVLVGPDNTGDYEFLGSIVGGSFRVSSKSRIGRDAPSAKAFDWFWRHLGDDRVEVWHEGRCGRCGRSLTVPESIASGIGPECARRAA